jgi:hypothetical protein
MHMVQIELRQADPLGRTVVVSREHPAMLNNGELEGCAKSWVLTVHEGSVGDWLRKLITTGITRYQLVDGFGKRSYGPQMETYTNQRIGCRPRCLILLSYLSYILFIS